MKTLLLLLVLLSSTSSSNAMQKHSRVRRKTGLSSIISNYFTSNPIIKKAETKKPRIHLPRRTGTRADQTVSSSMPQPRPIRLGPPIRILPTITLPNLPSVTQRSPTSFEQSQRQDNNKRVPAPLLVGMKDERRLPASERKGVLVRGTGGAAPPEQTFSQLISRTKVISIGH